MIDLGVHPNDEREIITSIRPGITDLATLWIGDEGTILEGSEDPGQTYLEEIWPKKRRLQIEYVQNRSMLLDAKIMFRTGKLQLWDRFKR